MNLEQIKHNLLCEVLHENHVDSITLSAHQIKACIRLLKSTFIFEPYFGKYKIKYLNNLPPDEAKQISLNAIKLLVQMDEEINEKITEDIFGEFMKEFIEKYKDKECKL